jgi:Uma2 family endonuclease
MALLQISEIPRTVHGNHVYVRPPQPLHFPSFEDPEEAVSEGKRHLLLRTTLFLLLEDVFTARGAIGSDQFVYWNPLDPRKCLSPDVFVKLGVPNGIFDNWKVWERGAPDLAVEIVSKSDRPEDEWSQKLGRYAASGIGEVVRFDPETAAFSVWDRVEGDLVERSAEDPALFECSSLGLWWVVVPSADGPTLRLANDKEGKDILPTPAEDRLRLQQELADERRERALAQHERALAQHERALAHQRALDEEAARRKAEAERDALAAEVERLRAELDRSR